MGDYVPDEYTAKQMYVLQRQSMHNHISPDYGAEFDRFINKVEAGALREAGAAVMGERLETETEAGNWLDERAERIEAGEA